MLNKEIIGNIEVINEYIEGRRGGIEFYNHKEVRCQGCCTTDVKTKKHDYYRYKLTCNNCGVVYLYWVSSQKIIDRIVEIKNLKENK